MKKDDARHGKPAFYDVTGFGGGVAVAGRFRVGGDAKEGTDESVA